MLSHHIYPVAVSLYFFCTGAFHTEGCNFFHQQPSWWIAVLWLAERRSGAMTSVKWTALHLRVVRTMVVVVLTICTDSMSFCKRLSFFFKQSTQSLLYDNKQKCEKIPKRQKRVESFERSEELSGFEWKINWSLNMGSWIEFKLIDRFLLDLLFR